MNNDKLKYEFEFIRFLNNKTYSEFSEKWKKHLKRMFPDIKEDTVVHCYKHENYLAKGDIDIRIPGSKVIVSLKNGKNPCMHKERFTTFYYELKDMGISNETLSVLTLYQFGECKAFGHYDKPLTKDEIAAQYGPKLLKANQELNNERILDKIIERAVIKGKQEYRQPIDYFYYGNLSKGILVSVDQIRQSIKSRKELSSKWLHFGQLIFQPSARSRETTQYLDISIHWPVISKLFYLAEDEDDVLAYDIENKRGASNETYEESVHTPHPIGDHQD